MIGPDEMHSAKGADLSLRNSNCIYCGSTLTRNNRSREHVIARNFIPAIASDVNLISWACITCNGKKADLEDDVSLITMLPRDGQTYPNKDLLRASIERKAKRTVSRRTRKLVSESNESFNIEGEIFSGLKVSFNFLSGPQLDPHRVFQLAQYHIQAFFYLTTYNREKRTGALIPGVFGPVAFTLHSDWGNSLMRGFMTMTSSWDPRIILNGQETYFRCVSRRNADKDIWSWALEWNRNVRVIGFFGKEELVKTAFAELPQIQKKQFSQANGIVYRSWEEIALPIDEDNLFPSAI